MPQFQRTPLPNGGSRYEPVRPTPGREGFNYYLLILGWVFIASIWQLVQSFTMPMLILLGGLFLMVIALWLGVRQRDRYPTAVTLHEGKLGVAWLKGDHIHWVSEITTNEITELVSAIDRPATWPVRWNPAPAAKSATLCVVTGDRTRRPLQLISGPPADLAVLARQILSELNGPEREMPVTYREESAEFTGEPRTHQPAWSRLRASVDGEVETFGLDSVTLHIDSPRVRSTWFNWGRKTHRLTAVVIRLDPDGISVSGDKLTQAWRWDELQGCRIKTEQVQIPEQGSDTVYRIEFTTIEQGRWSISGMWGRDAEWLLFHIHKRGHFQTANRDNG